MRLPARTRYVLIEIDDVSPNKLASIEEVEIQSAAWGDGQIIEGCAIIPPIFFGRPTTLNGKSQMTPVRRQGTASETTPRITTHRRPVARPRMAQIPPPPPSWPDGAGTAGFLPVEINHNKPFNHMSRETQTAPRGPRFSHTQSSTAQDKEESHDNRKSTQWKAVCGKSARTV